MISSEFEADIRAWWLKKHGVPLGAIEHTPPLRRHLGEFNPLDDQYYYLHYVSMNHRDYSPVLNGYTRSAASIYLESIYRGH